MTWADTESCSPSPLWSEMTPAAALLHHKSAGQKLRSAASMVLRTTAVSKEWPVRPQSHMSCSGQSRHGAGGDLHYPPTPCVRAVEAQRMSEFIKFPQLTAMLDRLPSDTRQRGWAESIWSISSHRRITLSGQRRADGCSGETLPSTNRLLSVHPVCLQASV